MANIVKKMVRKEPLGSPEEEGYIPQGRRLTVFANKRGSQRAVEMLLARLNDKEFKTELPMPVFDKVEPALPIRDLSKATIALVTSGGIVPKGNPDRIESASAPKMGEYDIVEKRIWEQITILFTVVMTQYMLMKPDRVAPLIYIKTV